MITKLFFLFMLLSSAAATCVSSVAEELPRGVPHTIWPDGSVYVEPTFTTPEYEKEALTMLVREANQVAGRLRLPEKLPITETEVVDRYIAPFGYAHKTKSIGKICTTNYCYSVREGNKFSDLVIANYDETCLRYKEKYQQPITQMDTNAAYRLATQWLAAVSIDVNALNRDCQARVTPTTFWNEVNTLGEMPKGPKFVPIYYVWWTSPQNRADGYGCVASVELLLPTKKLLQLYTYDARYVLRQPITFTNLPSLFPNTNVPVVVITNWPAIKEMDAPSANASATAKSDGGGVTQREYSVHSPVQFAKQISLANRIVCTNFLSSEGETKVSLIASAERAKRIVKAISTATRLEDRTNSMWDWQLRFYAGTNFLAAIRFQGKVFLTENGEFADETGELEKLYTEAFNLVAAKRAEEPPPKQR